MLIATGGYAQSDSARLNYVKIITNLPLNDSILRLVNCAGATRQHRDSSLIVRYMEPSSQIKHLLHTDLDNKPHNDFFADSINKQGYVQRSINNGNNKDLSISTQMDLKLHGKLNGGLEIDARIVDSDMPVDADGTTCKVSELSQTTVTVSKNGVSVSAGDLRVVDDQSLFTSLSKKIKGVEVCAGHSEEGAVNDTVYVQTDFALGKGKFKRMNFYGVSNSSGPYYLTDGDNANTIVLSGSETVWLDGVKLNEGSNKDYTIDYNAGSIMFSPLIVIDEQNLITVDYEYSETIYNNIFIKTSTGIKRNGFDFKINYLSDMDGKQSDNLTETDLSALSDPENTNFIASSVKESEFLSSGIYYVKRDSIIGDIEYKDILVYVSAKPLNENVYTSTFRYVGAGKGLYSRSNESSANGTVYRFDIQGDYSAEKILIAPRSKMYTEIFAGFEPDSLLSVGLTLAGSSLRNNRFLSDKYADRSGAGQLSIKKIFLLDSVSHIQLSTDYTYKADGFKCFSTPESPDFFWKRNITNYSEGYRERIFNCIAEYKEQNGFYTSVGFNFADARTLYKSTGANLCAGYAGKTLKIDNKINYYNTLIADSTMRNFEGYSSITIYKGEYYHGALLKINNRTSTNDTSAQSGGDIEIFTGRQSDKINYKFSAVSNQSWNGYDFARSNKGAAQYLSGRAELNFEDFKLHCAEVLKRSRNYVPEGFTESEYVNSLSGSIGFSSSLFKNRITISGDYSSVNSSEEQSGFVYLKTTPGSGYYVWNDYNNNEVEELDEFEKAYYQSDADYVRYYIHTGKFVNVNTGAVKGGIIFNGFDIKNKGLFLEYLSKISGSVNATRTDKAVLSGNNLFSFFADSLLTRSNSLNYSIRYAVNDKLNLNFQKAFNHGETSTIYGSETTENRTTNYNIEIFPVQFITIKPFVEVSTDKYFSEFFENKNRTIETGRIASENIFKIKSYFSLSFTGSIFKKSVLNDSINLKSYLLKSEIVINNKNCSIKSSISYINNNMEGQATNSIGYELLEGLEQGKNIVAEAGISYMLMKYLQININWQMQNNTHTGNVVLKLVF